MDKEIQESIIYKTPKTVEEQVLYLISDKNVILNKDDFDYAKTLVLKRNYINLITPFKHLFALSYEDNVFKSKKDSNGKHIYKNPVDFFEYSIYYEDEREDYNLLYDGIIKFEVAFKSLVSYTFLHKFQVVNSKVAEFGFKTLVDKIPSINLKSQGDYEAIRLRKNQMKISIKRLESKLYPRKTKYGTKPGVDIYILLDRMGLRDVINIFYCLSSLDKKKIFEQMTEWDLTLGADNLEIFSKRIFNLVSIRNAIMHSNSLTILLKYETDNKKKIRSNNSRKNYEDIIYALKYISKNCDL